MANSTSPYSSKGKGKSSRYCSDVTINFNKDFHLYEDMLDTMIKKKEVVNKGLFYSEIIEWFNTRFQWYGYEIPYKSEREKSKKRIDCSFYDEHFLLANDMKKSFIQNLEAAKDKMKHLNLTTLDAWMIAVHYYHEEYLKSASVEESKRGQRHELYLCTEGGLDTIIKTVAKHSQNRKSELKWRVRREIHVAIIEFACDGDCQVNIVPTTEQTKTEDYVGNSQFMAQLFLELLTAQSTLPCQTSHIGELILKLKEFR